MAELDKTVLRPTTSRSDSLASTSSSVALSRRSRTRTRSRPATREERTGATSGDVAPADHGAMGTHMRTPVDMPIHLDIISVSGPPKRPERSPNRILANNEVLDTKAGPETEDAQTISRAEEPNRAGRTFISKAAIRGASLPRLASGRSERAPPSSFSPVSPYSNPRDSVLTQQTSASSSIYPPSTSTSTMSSSEFPPSPHLFDDDDNVSSFDPDADYDTDTDTDDVSYRLRLLVKNNYFLPPAHSKPSPSDFPPSPGTRKAPPSSFLDLFRVGKSRSKATTPEPSESPNHLTPVLRTTSDSTTASGYVRRPHARSAPHTPAPTLRHNPQRVVVVREKMDDLFGAVQQAERDMKARDARRDNLNSTPRVQDIDIVDPTDAVDVPPPPAGYPFAVQASAAHGFGVEDSVGAALLADCLPPNSPNSVSLNPNDDAWRKALLHEAVGFSLSSGSAAESSFTSPPSSPSVQVVRLKPVLDKKILATPSEHEHSSSGHLTGSARPKQSRTHRRKASPSNHPVSRASYLPARSESPTALTPLTPAPRNKSLVNPLYSLSQTDLPSSRRSASPEPLPRSKIVRRSLSSPMLVESYEKEVSYSTTLSPTSISPPPPSMPTVNVSESPAISLNPHDSALSFPKYDRKDSISVYSQYSGRESGDFLVDVHDPRSRVSTMNSQASTVHTRPPTSFYSQQSPSTSAFQDAWSTVPAYNSQHSSVSLLSSASASGPPARGRTVSSNSKTPSLGALSTIEPPPRSSSLKHNFPASASPPLSPRSPDAPGLHIRAPSPTTPPFSTSEFPDRTSIGLSLSAGLRTASRSASPTDFFDTIQSHPNAMDDLDESSSSEDERSFAGSTLDLRRYGGSATDLFAEPHSPAVSTRPSIASSSSRPSLMRLRNHSTPHVARPSADTLSPHRVPPLPPHEAAERKKPIANIPDRPRPRFFSSSSKKARKIEPIVSGVELYQHTMRVPGRHSSSTEPAPQRAFGMDVFSRPATAGGPPPPPPVQKRGPPDESVRKLDGLLAQHIEAEKDTIRRITTSLVPPRKTRS
ncbi:hypothetical protein PLICRDRAFT_697736 [Plicaturopsis crispa FD-325 SS-3]|nr:hypothetical protein PLICRDRAFT_697736 [Plicaturopsis crispa FD-325 SS-3]